MSVIRSLVTNYIAGAIPRDRCTNVVYHSNSTGFPNPSVDWTNHANEVLQAFIGGTDDTTFDLYSGRVVEVRCYDMADATPRPEKAFVSHDGSPQLEFMGPAEIAVVLSFFAGRNIPGLRSHIFLGPLTMSNIGSQQAGLSGERPGTSLRTRALALGAGLFNVGGGNVSHVIRHPAATKSGHAAGSVDVVTDYWVGDAWGAVHSRNLRTSTRATAHH